MAMANMCIQKIETKEQGGQPVIYSNLFIIIHSSYMFLYIERIQGIQKG